jgi:hypothetical protein
LRELVAVALAALSGCGLLPSDSPKRPVAAGADVQALFHTWIVEDHVLVKGASVTDEDAIGFHGRTIDITDTGFTSPWQGTCDDAGRTRRARTLPDLIDELEMEPTAHARATAFGMSEAIREYRLTCNDRRKPPPLTIYVSNGKAMTCYSGACYLMKPF